MKALLIGSSFSAMPFLVELKRQEFEVFVIGKYKNDPCHSYSDRSIFEDYSDAMKLLEVCKHESFDFIIPTCNDYSYVAGSEVAQAMQLPGFDSPAVTAILHTKDKFRQFCLQSGIPAPTTYGEIAPGASLEEIQGRMTGAALVKPVDSFSGRGVERIRRSSDLPDAAARAINMSRSGKAVVEEYVEGSLHSHTAFISGGDIIWHQFVDEYCEVYQYQVDRSTFPTQLSTGICDAVNRSIKHLVASLGLCNGLLHTQFISSNEKYWIIECMRRCPGDLYGHHFKFSFDYNYEAQYLAGFIGKAPQPPLPSNSPILAVERRVLSVSSPEAFFAVELEDAKPNAIFIPLKESGQRLEAAPFDKAGILFSRGDEVLPKDGPTKPKVSMLFSQV